LAAGPLLLAQGNEKPKESAVGVKRIGVNDAASLIEENKDNPDFVILDVRTPGEFSEGYIENALNLDVNSESFRDEVVKLDTGKTYLIHCRSGARSARVGALMEELGFDNIYDMEGGFIAWEKEGLPVTK